MKNLAEKLTQYAAYHRDRRNIATHFVGVPLIVFAVVLALAPVTISVNLAFPVTLAALVCVAGCAYYLWLDLTLGIAMVITMFVMLAGASEITHRLPTAATLALAAGIFIVGWAIQFVGHKFEGMKPAFFDDAKQLLIGPLFVMAEAFFLLGAKPQLRRYIEDRVGPTVARRDGRPIPIHEEAHS